MTAFIDSRFAKFVSCTMVFALASMSFPFGSIHIELPPPDAPEKQPAPSRPLTSKELKASKGRTIAQNPYIAGSQKWGINVNGVDMLTGNFAMSATDLSFEGGYGIPVNVTRSYSANNADEGPFGFGWSLSVDIRSTAGGVLKGPGSPIRSVPTNFKERPTSQTDDPHISSTYEPVEAVVATDSSGYEETIQRDVDGILTTPPWDKNVMESDYEVVTNTNGTYRLLISNTLTTIEGTTYAYTKHGSYGTPPTYGSYPIGDPSATHEPCNVLKIDSVTDRQGNETEYHYNGTTTFSKMNGTVTEDKLDYIEMPNGHRIYFVWGSSGLANRIVQVKDQTSGGREIDYGYGSSGASAGCLTSVTSNGGLVTHYGYGSASDPLDVDPDGGNVYLLTSITDPRGLETDIAYVLADTLVTPYGVSLPGIRVHTIVKPNGVYCYYVNEQIRSYSSLGIPALDGTLPGLAYQERIGGSSGTVIAEAMSSFIGPGSGTTCSTFLISGLSIVPNLGVETTGSTGYNAVGRSYNVYTEDCIEEYQRDRPFVSGDSVSYDRKLQYVRNDGSSHDLAYQSTDVVTDFNFMGNPLAKTVTEEAWYVGASGHYSNAKTVTYAYHGKDKYFQQKAVKDPVGRVSYTDYYDDSSTAGKKGQTYRVYDPKHSAFSYTTGDWANTIHPSDTSKYSAQFDYDSKGRPTAVLKLQSAPTSGSWGYVKTTTTYKDSDSTYWGNAWKVTEDDDQSGYTGIKRITETCSYDAVGRSTCVKDATGKYWVTTYNDDGQVTSVDYYVGSTWYGITQYTYGSPSSGINAGMVLSALDQLSNISQDFVYCDSNSGGESKGQVQSVTEHFGTDYDSSSEYYYNGAGDRSEVIYTTPNGATRWGYWDYETLGSITSPHRVFRTMNKLDSSDEPTAEEFHYQYDTQGRLQNAAFAQLEQSSHYYSASYPAATRVRAFYNYDPSGRVLSLENYYDTYGSGAYSSAALIGNACTYDSTLGLKTESNIIKATSGAWNSTPSLTQDYTYDSDLDYLTQEVISHDVSSTTSWTYDAAGNRSNSGYTYDSLNRMTASPGSHTYTNDILGNRTWRDGSSSSSSAARYTWDEVGRMFSYCTPTSGAKYWYRADGMRSQKIEGLSLNWVETKSKDDEASSGYYDPVWASNKPTTRYYYDGQMACEEDYTNGSTYTTTRYGIGARGVDYIAKTASSTTVVYPLYDAHGNMIANVNTSGTLADGRYFDAWGNIIGSGSATGEPKGRYCANLGHVQDDESSLIYMRARYYEPGTGRFVSEDHSHQGWNLFSYCNGNPVDRVDPSGGIWYSIISVIGYLLTIGAAMLSINNFANGMNVEGSVFTVLAGLLIVADILGWKLFCDDIVNSVRPIWDHWGDRIKEQFVMGIEGMRSAKGVDGIGRLELYSMECQIYLMDIE